MKNEKRFTLATAAVFFFALAGAARAFAAHADDYSCAYPDKVHFPLTLSYPAGGKPQVLRLDFGEASTGGYAVFDVASAKGCPVMRVTYANNPDGLGEKGCFSRETSARYLGPTFDIPALPGNINRHEIYRICRTGRFVAPLIQGQQRYARIQLDTPGTEVTLSSFKIENAAVFRDGEFQGSFSCSDSRLDELWKISAWTCQIAAFPNHDAWKRAGGRLLPRKLEAASGEGFCALPAPFDGTLTVEYEFDANPHFPQGRFEVIAGGRRTEVVQTSTNEMNTVSVPVARGERFGIAVEKESWPVIASISISPKKGDRFWDARLDDPKSLLNWDFARTLPYVADGAKRDRLIWSGDLWWAERNIFYSFNPGNEPYMRGSVMLLGFNQTPEGYVQACPYAERATPPAKGEWGPFPSDEFAAWFVPVLYDYFLYSGDAKTTGELYPKVMKLMDYLAAHTEDDGTFVQRAETSKHACNLNLGDTSHRAYMDILLWKCCRDAAAMACAFGDKDGTSRFEKWSEKLWKAIRTRFWNDNEGFFELSDKNHGFGFEANALALATHFATREEALRIAPHLKRRQVPGARGARVDGVRIHGPRAQGDRGAQLVQAAQPEVERGENDHRVYGAASKRVGRRIASRYGHRGNPFCGGAGSEADGARVCEVRDASASMRLDFIGHGTCSHATWHNIRQLDDERRRSGRDGVVPAWDGWIGRSAAVRARDGQWQGDDGAWRSSCRRLHDRREERETRGACRPGEGCCVHQCEGPSALLGVVFPRGASGMEPAQPCRADPEGQVQGLEQQGARQREGGGVADDRTWRGEKCGKN